MANQNYSNHRRWVPAYHFVLSILVLATFIGSIVNLVKSIDTSGIYSASLIVAMNVAFLIVFFYMRVFPLMAQDRAILVEENLRHYVLTGKLIDSKVTTRQIIGARFASDEELPALLEKAASEGLSENDVKKAIKNWKADNYRV